MSTQALQESALFQTGYLVDGVWKTLETTFEVLNPASGEVIARVAKAGKKRDRRGDSRRGARLSRLAGKNRQRALNHSLSLV